METNRIHPVIRLRRSLNNMILGVTFGMAFFTVFNGPAYNAFIRLLDVSEFLYSFLVAMPVVGGVLQVVGSMILERTGRRKPVFIIAGFVHRLAMIPVALLPLIMPQAMKPLMIALIVTFVVMSSVARSITIITFSSWLGDLVPQDIRGGFLGKRAMISTISAALTALATGQFLDMVPGYTGYAMVFVLCSLLGAADILCFFWVDEPKFKKSPQKAKTLDIFVLPFRDRNYRNFLWFATVWSFAINFASPFFIVYMQEDLKLTFFQISAGTQFVPNLITILCISRSGRMMDIYGAKPVMRLFNLIIAFIPILWAVSTPSSYWVVILIGILTGISWPMYELSVLSLSISLSPEKNRSGYLAAYALVVALFGTAFANLCGGLFMELVRPVLDRNPIPFLFGFRFNAFHIMFILSAFIRLAAILVFENRFEEAKSVPFSAMIKRMASKAQ